MFTKLTKEEIKEIKNKLVELPAARTMNGMILFAVENDIPVEYFVYAGIITEDNIDSLDIKPSLILRVGECMRYIKEEDSKETDKKSEKELEKEITEDTENVGYDDNEIPEDTEDTQDIEDGEDIEDTGDDFITDLKKGVDWGEDEKTRQGEIYNSNEEKLEIDKNQPSAKIDKTVLELKKQIKELEEDKERLKEEIKFLNEKYGIKSTKSLVATSYANKGGVGKTTVAISIASILAEAGRKTIIYGCDYGGKSLNSFFKLKKKCDNYFKDTENLDKHIVRINKDLFLLPYPDEIYSRDIKGKDIEIIIDKLKSMFEVVVIDTCPAPYEKEYMFNIFEKSDLVYAVVNQSKFSRDETKIYVPKMIYMGVNPENIRIVVNQYNPELVDIKEVEKDFVSGIKTQAKGRLPKTAAIIPDNWVESNKALEKGKVTNREIWLNLCKEIDDTLRGEVNNNVKDIKTNEDKNNEGKKRFKFF